MLVAKKTQRINHKSVNHNLIKGKKISEILDKTLSDYAKKCLFEKAEKENYVEVKIDKVDAKNKKQIHDFKAKAEQAIAEAKSEGENLKIDAQERLAEVKKMETELKKKLAEAEKQLAEAKKMKAEAEKKAKA